MLGLHFAYAIAGALYQLQRIGSERVPNSFLAVCFGLSNFRE